MSVLVVVVGLASSGCSFRADDYRDAQIKLQVAAEVAVRGLASALGSYPAGATALTQTEADGFRLVHIPELSAEFLPTSEPYDPEVVAAALRRLGYTEIFIAERGAVGAKLAEASLSIRVTPSIDSPSGLVEARFSGTSASQSESSYREDDFAARQVAVPLEVSLAEIAEIKGQLQELAKTDVPGLAKAGLPTIARRGRIEVRRADSSGQFQLELSVDAADCYLAYLANYLPSKGYFRPRDSDVMSSARFVRTDSPVVVECEGSDADRQLVYRTAQPIRLAESGSGRIEPEAEWVRLW